MTFNPFKLRAQLVIVKRERDYYRTQVQVSRGEADRLRAKVKRLETNKIL
jgi:hypothetical protein